MDNLPLFTRERDLLILVALRELPGHLIEAHIWPHIREPPQAPGAPIRRGRRQEIPRRLPTATRLRLSVRFQTE